MKSIKENQPLSVLLERVWENRYLTPEEKKLLQGFITKAKKETNIFRVKSEILRRICEVKIPKQESLIVTEENMHNFFSSVIKKELDAGNLAPKIDSDIWEMIFSDVLLADENPFSVHLYTFLRFSLTYHELYEESKRLKIEKIYSPLQAFAIMRELALKGFSEKKMATVVFCSCEGSSVYPEGTLLHCSIYREPSLKQLCIKMRPYSVSKYKPAMYQACFN